MNKIVKGVAIIGGGVTIGAIIASLMAEPTEYTFDIKKGWNYISFPMIPDIPDPHDIFGYVIYSFNSSTNEWESPDSVECQKGYGLYSPEDKTVTITGTKCVVELLDLIEFYNQLVGTPYEEALWALVGPGTKNINVTGSVLDERIQSYNRETGEYEYTNILEPMNGYWMEKPVTV